MIYCDVFRLFLTFRHHNFLFSFVLHQGRFIECEKGTGRYYEIPYKKALDKTSQALREKDKDGEDEDDGVDGLNLTLVRIPLPEEAARSGQQVHPSQMQSMNPNMPFSQPFGGGNMTPQQVVQQAKLVNQANVMKAAGLKRLSGGGTMQGPAGMNPAQQAILMQAQAAAVRAIQPNGMLQNGQSPPGMSGPHGMMPNYGTAGPNASNRHQQQQQRPNTMPKSKSGPTVNPSLQNVHPQYAAMFHNNPDMPRGPRVLDPTGAPRFGPTPPKKPPPSGMPQVLGPSGAPAVQVNGVSQTRMPQSNGPMPPLSQNGNGNGHGGTTHDSLNGQTALQAPQRSVPGPAAAVSAKPTPALPLIPVPTLTQSSNSTTTNKSATAALEGLAHIAAVQAMEPTSTRPLVGKGPNSMQQQYMQMQQQQILPLPSAQQMGMMMMMNQQQSHAPTAQQMGIMMMNPTMAQQMGMMLQQQQHRQQQQQHRQTHPSSALQFQNAAATQQQGTINHASGAPAAPQMGIMMMPQQQQFQQGEMGSFLQHQTNIQQATMQTQQQQPAVPQEQAGEKRQPYSDQTPNNEQQEYKKQRLEIDDMPLPPDALERRSSSMAEFLRDALTSKGGKGTNGGGSKQSILDQMTPQQMQQLALGLFQLAQQQQSGGSLEQQQVPPLTSPGLQALPLNRTDHSLGSIGSKSSVETNSSGEGGPPTTQLKAQVSDWLQHFFPVQQDEGGSKTSDGGDEKLPPPPSLEKSVSEALLSLSTGPTRLLSDISSILNEKANAARESSTASAAAAAAPQSSLNLAASTVSVETSASSATIATANGSLNVPQKGELMKKTSTTLPRRGTKTIPPNKMLKLQSRYNNTGKRNQKPLLPLRPRPTRMTTPATTKRRLLPLKPRPGAVHDLVSSKQQASIPHERPRSIQEEMTDILRQPSSNSVPNKPPAAAPGAPPMLQLKRSDSVRPPPSHVLLVSNEKGPASVEKETDTET